MELRAPAAMVRPIIGVPPGSTPFDVGDTVAAAVPNARVFGRAQGGVFRAVTGIARPRGAFRGPLGHAHGVRCCGAPAPGPPTGGTRGAGGLAGGTRDVH